MNRTVIIYNNDFIDAEKIIDRFDGFNIIELFSVDKNLLSTNSVDNTVYSDLNTVAANPFYEFSKDIIEYICHKSITDVILLLPNESLKKTCENFRFCYGVKFYLLPYYLCTNKCITNSSLIEIDLTKPRLKMVQINIAQHCNLNCKGCANYSSLVSSQIFNNIDRVISDFKQLKNFFWGIETIKLMGGEPLLNPELPSYLKPIRELFPDAHIEIGTNGTLICNAHNHLFAEMLSNNIEFVISIYPHTHNLQSKIEAKLCTLGIKYKIFEFKGQFMKYLYETPSADINEAYRHCPAYECHCMEDGFLSVCARPLYINRLNNVFNTHFPTDGGKWNIYKTTIDSWELDELLHTPFNSCAYCGPKHFFDWNTYTNCSPSKYDWVISEQNSFS